MNYIPEILSILDNIKLNSSARHMIRENGILVIDQLQSGSDSGEYVCAIEGPSGKITSKTLLEFKGEAFKFVSAGPGNGARDETSQLKTSQDGTLHFRGQPFQSKRV